jgi:hypothetical protein
METYHLEHLWPVIDDIEYIRRGKEPADRYLKRIPHLFYLTPTSTFSGQTNTKLQTPTYMEARHLSINPCVSFATRLVYYAWFLYYLPVVRNTNKNLPLYICNFRVALVSSLLMWKKGGCLYIGCYFYMRL